MGCIEAATGTLGTLDAHDCSPKDIRNDSAPGNTPSRPTAFRRGPWTNSQNPPVGSVHRLHSRAEIKEETLPGIRRTPCERRRGRSTGRRAAAPRLLHRLGLTYLIRSAPHGQKALRSLVSIGAPSSARRNRLSSMQGQGKTIGWRPIEVFDHEQTPMAAFTRLPSRVQLLVRKTPLDGKAETVVVNRLNKELV
jgi:hypothetical protein